MCGSDLDRTRISNVFVKMDPDPLGPKIEDPYPKKQTDPIHEYGTGSRSTAIPTLGSHEVCSPISISINMPKIDLRKIHRLCTYIINKHQCTKAHS